LVGADDFYFSSHSPMSCERDKWDNKK